MQLRPYQSQALGEIDAAWRDGAQNVLVVMPTGAGKTVLFSDVVRRNEGASCAIAHRQELVSQMSLTLARNEVSHRIIASEKTIRTICAIQLKVFGRTYYNPSSPVAVAGVDTLIRRAESLKRWLPTVTLWVQDEGHHTLRANKWGKACEMFPNARGLLVTATPERSDGAGLGRHADGLVDVMIEGPTARDLINAEYLTDYKIYAPPSSLGQEIQSFRVSAATGDYVQSQVREAVNHSSLVVDDGKSRGYGDIVESYLRFANGKLGVTFMPDVESSARVAQQFSDAGVPAAVVSAKTPDMERVKLLEDFRERRLLQLVNVDLFGEGFDLPAIEVVSMGRPTASYGLYVQQFGRALRPMEGKSHAIIIDHVGNVMRHGLPDAPRKWSLDRRDKRSNGQSDAIPTRVCLECTAVYERFLKACPFCGAVVPPPSERSSMEWVDGDLTELDPSVLARLRGEVEQADKPTQEAVAEYRAELERKGAPHIGVLAHTKRFAAKHSARLEAVEPLRDAMAWWAGHHRTAGRSDAEIFRLFYLRFGTDWLGAQTLEADAMAALAERVRENTGVM